jgi:hypothetical protein
MSKKWKTGLAVSGFVAALLIGGATITSSALAQEMDPPADEEAPLPPRATDGPRCGTGSRRGGPENAEVIAEVLGLTVEELEAARAEEGRLHDVLEIDGETFREAREAAHAQIIEQAVTDGVLTEAQAEGMSSHSGPGGHGGRGGMHPGGPRPEGERGEIPAPVDEE